MRRVRTLVSLLALVPLTGCLVTGALDPTGGGRFTARMRLVSVAHFDRMKAALQSDDVTLRSASMSADKWATFEFESADIQKLSTAAALAHTTVAVTDGGDGTRTVTATFANLAPDQVSDAFARYLGRDFVLSVELPGEVTHSTATSSAGRSVSWKWPIAEVSHRRQVVISASYRSAPAS